MKYDVIDDNVKCIECYDENTYIMDREEHGDYKLEDCALVRTTHGFPFNHEVHTPIFDHLYDFALPEYFQFVITEVLKKYYPDTWQEEEKKYFTYYEILRDTLHFTINGLVKSSIYGNFDARPYIIIEPLKHQIDNPPLSLRAEDTFFEGNLTLSEECTLLIKYDVYEMIKNDPEYIEDLKKYRIIVYKGENEVQAVHNALEILGYDAFMISDHGYTERDGAAEKMTTLLNKLAQERGISQTKHRYTKNHKEEEALMAESNKRFDREYAEYILGYGLEHGCISEEFAEYVLEIIDKYNYFSAEHREAIKEMIELIGLERLAVLTAEFNEMKVQENRMKKQGAQR